MRRAVTLLPLLLFVGCKRPATPPAITAADSATLGAVEGTVTLTGKAPVSVEIDMAMDPACGFGPKNHTEGITAADGKLANVFVYIKTGAPSSSAPADAKPIVLDQKGCRYTPHVIAVQQGGSVEFRNSDPTMHNIHTTPADGSSAIDVSEMPMGTPQVKRFDTPQIMLPVRCNNHPWMQAFLNVAPTPYFAVTDAAGHFRIPDLPAGTYTLAAVHEKLGEQDATITVTAHQTTTTPFAFTTKP